MKPSIIKIDRSNSFNIERFPNYGYGQYIAGQNERSLIIDELRLSSVSLLTTIPRGDILVSPKDHQEKLKSGGYIKLDAKIFETLWDDQQLIPESWKKYSRIDFEGTEFGSKQFPRSTDFLTLKWELVAKKDRAGNLYTDFAWMWHYHSCDDYRYGGQRTAVVKPVE